MKKKKKRIEKKNCLINLNENVFNSQLAVVSRLNKTTHIDLSGIISVT